MSLSPSSPCFFVRISILPSLSGASLCGQASSCACHVSEFGFFQRTRSRPSTWHACGLLASVVTAQSTGYHCCAQLNLDGGGGTAAAASAAVSAVWKEEVVAATVEVAVLLRERRRGASGVVFALFVVIGR